MPYVRKDPTQLAAPRPSGSAVEGEGSFEDGHDDEDEGFHGTRRWRSSSSRKIARRSLPRHITW